MFKILIVLLSLFSLTLPAASAVCTTDTYDTFFSYIVKKKVLLYEISPSASQKVINSINIERKKTNLFLLAADQVYYANLNVNQKIGIAMFKDNCGVTGSFIVMDILTFAELMTDAGITPSDTKLASNMSI